MSSDQLILSATNLQPATQEPFGLLHDPPNAPPLVERTADIVHSFQEIVDVYNQTATSQPTNDLLVRMTVHSQSLQDFQSFCVTGIQELKAYMLGKMAQWEKMAQSQVKELGQLRLALEQQSRSRKQEAKTLKNVEAQLQAKEKALNEAEKEQKQHEKNVAELQKKLAAAQQEARTQTTLVKAHELKIQQLNSQIGAHKKDLHDAKKQVPNLQAAAADKKKLESKIAELDRGLSAAQSKSRVEEDKAANARNERNTAIEKQKALSLELHEARKQLYEVQRKAESDFAAKTARSRLNDEIWKEKLFSLEQEHTTVKESLGSMVYDLLATVQEKSWEIQGQREEIQSQREEVQRQREEIESQCLQIQNQQEQIQNQQGEIHTLREELKHERSESAMLKRMFTDTDQKMGGVEKRTDCYQAFGDEDIADRIRLRNLLDHTQAWLAKKAGLGSTSEDQSTEHLSVIWRASLDPERSTRARVQIARNLLAGKDLGEVAQSFVDNTGAMQIVCEIWSRFRGRGNETHRTLDLDKYNLSIDRFFEMNPNDNGKPFLATMLSYSFT